jgi:hypothetical protein
MSRIISTVCHAHLGDNIINFIFFYKLKDYIESNNILIHYYCLKQYHKNLIEFNCSKNISILGLDYDLDFVEIDKIGYLLWQGHNTPYQHVIEDKLCGMFNIFLQKYNIPISVNSFEYQDPDLITRYNILNDIYKKLDILIINSSPLSGQYKYNKPEWDNFIINLHKKYSLATTQKVNDNILSLDNISVKDIAAMALHVKIIIAINTGPSIPLYNTDILNNVDVIYLFGGDGGGWKTRKIRLVNNLNELSFL